MTGRFRPETFQLQNLRSREPQESHSEPFNTLCGLTQRFFILSRGISPAILCCPLVGMAKSLCVRSKRVGSLQHNRNWRFAFFDHGGEGNLDQAGRSRTKWGEYQVHTHEQRVNHNSIFTFSTLLFALGMNINPFIVDFASPAGLFSREWKSRRTTLANPFGAGQDRRLRPAGPQAVIFKCNCFRAGQLANSSKTGLQRGAATAFLWLSCVLPGCLYLQAWRADDQNGF